MTCTEHAAVRRLDDDNSGTISQEEFTEAVSKGILNDILAADSSSVKKKDVNFNCLLRVSL